MILDSRSGVRGVLVDAETGQRIPLARWANTETGDYEAFRTVDGKTPLRGVDGQPLVYRGQARLRFVPLAPKATPLATATVDPGRFLKRTPLLAVPGRECDEPKCHRLATWLVSDEQEIEPVQGVDGLLHERAITVSRRKYCDHHYRWPTVTSLRGVTNEVQVQARPQ